MLRHWLGLAVLAVAAAGLMPASGWGQEANPKPAPNDKEDVLALSRRIDAYLARRWKELGVTPAPLAEDTVYFRRLNLDLVGKIPSLTGFRDFTDNQDPDKRWAWVEELLANEASSRHFANIWRTIIIGRATNQQFRQVFPQFEVWLKEKFEKDTPLNEITRQILTAQTAVATPQFGGAPPTVQASAVAFYAVNENKAENLAGSTARIFLGVKIECAQCHAHPFASWSKEQFWEFAAFYSGVQPGVRVAVGGRPAVKPANYTPGREIPIPGTEKVAKAKYLNGAEPTWGAFSDSRKVLADWVVAPENPYFARAMADHLWSYFFGVSLLEPILEPSDDSPVTHEELLDDLAKELVRHNFDMKYLIRAMVHTHAYQRSSGGPALASKEDYHLFLRMPIRSLTPEQLFDSLAEATDYRQQSGPSYDMRFVNPFQQGGSPKGEFLQKFTNQERRYDPQTSILQSLFMMNGKFLGERTKIARNISLATLSKQPTSHARRIETLYIMVLSRPPRAEEADRLVRYLESGGPTGDSGRALEDIYWALLNSPEFLLNH